MLEKILQFTKEHRMIENGDRIIAGVSGGADSVCLLLVLCSLQECIDFELRVLHVEHGIRGTESIEDAEFVEKLCRKLGVECRCFSVDVLREAKDKRCTVEEAARNLRYGILKREADAWGHAKIAIAHNRQDDAETVLFHLIRGSGLNGLSGILPVRENIIRPLLHTDRSEILAYLEEQHQEYRTDSTNEDVRYSRNKLRAEVLPQLNEMNQQAVLHIQEASERIKEALDYISRQAESAEKKCVILNEESVTIQKENFFANEGVLRKEMIRRALFYVCKSQKDIELIHLQMIEELFLKQTGRKITLPYGMEAYRSYDGVEICRKKEEQEWEVVEFSKEMLELAAGEEIQCGEFTFCLLEQVENNENLLNFPQKTYTKWFDYDKIKSNLLIRGRREGDYFVCDKEGHIQKLKRYFVNEKVDAKERNRIPLLADDSHILWIVGYRISDYYKVQKTTGRILEVRYNGGEDDERISSSINS